MRQMLPCLATIVACASALMLPLGAGADPVGAKKIIDAIRQGYGATVAVRSNSFSTGQDGSNVIGMFTLQSRQDRGQQLTIRAQDGKVSEDDVKAAVYWLAQFPSDSRAETLSLLVYYTKPSAAFVNQFLKDTGLVRFPIDEHSSGLFTRSGEQVSTVEGGEHASGGQTLDALLDALSSLAELNNNNDDSLSAVLGRSQSEVETLATGAVEDMIQGLQEFPSDRTQPTSPPLVSAADARNPGVRQRLTSQILINLAAGIQDKITEKKGLTGKTDQKLLVGDIVDALKAAGVTDARVSVGGNELLITRGSGPEQEILVDGPEISQSKGTFYLGSKAVQSLNAQLEAKLGKAMMDVLFQRGATGEPAPGTDELEAAVSSLEKRLQLDPDKPKDPNDPKLNPGDPNGGSDGK